MTTSLLKWALFPVAFVQRDEFYITGRGQVLIVDCPSRAVYDNLMGSEVIIDGKRYLVRSVERTGYNSYEHHKDKTLGLLVRAIND